MHFSFSSLILLKTLKTILIKAQYRHIIITPLTQVLLFTNHCISHDITLVVIPVGGGFADL